MDVRRSGMVVVRVTKESAARLDELLAEVGVLRSRGGLVEVLSHATAHDFGVILGRMAARFGG